jgi:hypothetical protein
MLHHTQYADWLIGEVKKAQSPEIGAIHKIGGNKFTIEVKHGGHILRFRVLLYAVGTAGRSNPLERRVEITSTYSGGLTVLPDHVDVVLGIEREKRLLVGIDSRRLAHGGPTHNASTFVYLPSFEKLSKGGWFPLRTATQLFASEYQIYFKPTYLVNYLRQHETLHNSGLAQLPSAPVAENVVDQLDVYAANGSNTNLSYEQQVELALKKMQIGRIGEGIAFEAEKERLINLGKKNLAKKIKWASQTQPYLGYDILSYGQKSNKEYVEVKSSLNEVKRFYFTANEMRVAEIRGISYRLVCVSRVMTQPHIREFRDPMKAIADGLLVVEKDTSLVAIQW